SPTGALAPRKRFTNPPTPSTANSGLNESVIPCANLLDDFIAFLAFSLIPSESPSTIKLPISIITRDGDLTFKALRIVDDTLLAIPLAVDITLPRREFIPF